ncbi:MAG: threonine--tRNA ligase [SAR202 cluster bacterium]|nr:threonine--tRNA ligase [SAR202 cluster bacterium]
MPRKSADPELIDLRKRIRHSAAHVLAESVLKLFPKAKVTIGPPTDDGFYYDFDVDRPFTTEDLEKISALMQESIKANHQFHEREVDRDVALKLVAGNPYKQEIIEGIPEGEKITFAGHAEFEDLCRGGHVHSTREIRAFKLLSTAGAYWRGDERNRMLQRVYGTAWESKDGLEKYLHQIEEAEKRDHRKLGSELGLYLFDPSAPASPFFLPKGAIVYNELVALLKRLYRKYGYSEVITPQIFLADLWKRSGHYDNYKENMYFVEVDDREFGVKPMNCPGHALLFGASLHSYRDLPVRFADFGRLHRYERSGVTHGLTRVRTFVQDDAHIFCAPDQIAAEINGFIAFLREAYSVFKFTDIRVALSLRPEKRVGSDEIWDRAEAALGEVLDGSGLEYERMPGEGAFYGPKIDFFVPDAIGREWQLGTVQLDFSLPQRFDLEYVAEDGSRQRPVVIHRATLGSLERFIGVLIEHTAGALPLWLSPVQVAVIPITDRNTAYGHEVRSRLMHDGLRADLYDSNDRMNAKIRAAQLQKVPYMLVIGDREQAAGQVAVRKRSGEDLGAMGLNDVAVMLAAEAAERS